MYCAFDSTPLAGGRYRHVCRTCGLALECAEAAPRVHCRYKPDAQAKEKESPRPPGGPGTELAKILSRLGIREMPACQCRARAAEMDRQGIAWCKANRSTIIDWMQAEAANRKLPFVRIVAELLVCRAIRKARKNAISHKDHEGHKEN
jgi:hypothetical protein